MRDAEIAYHFRRLIAESLAEIVPQDDDWPLLRRLFREETELFRRLFWRIGGDDWWRLLFDYWLPSLASPTSEGEWHGLFVSQLDRWMNSHPTEVVSLWRRAFAEDWGDKNDLAIRISLQLHKFQHWDTEGVPELIEILLAENKAERDFLGKVLSMYTAATDQGDDLLWRYIVKDVDPQDIKGFDIGKKLHCDPHIFHDKEFLQGRLIKSDRLLDAAINALEEWAAKDGMNSSKHRLKSAFLHNSSWQYRHSQHDMHLADDLTVLIAGVEHAVRHHAQANDSWWKIREPQLRSAGEVSLRYFLIQAYKENPDANVDGIAHFLTDAELLRYGQLEHELDELIQAGCHLLPPDVQETNQNIILALYADEDWGDEDVPSWVSKIIYNYLIWIPPIFRFPVSQAFLERFQPVFGSVLPQPRIHSWGGLVGAPVPLEIFLKLKESDLFRLLTYYKGYNDYSSHPADYNKGGQDMVKRVLGEAAAIDPVCFLALLPALQSQDLWDGYAGSILEGVGNHLRYRFGRLQAPQNWQAVEPLPDGPGLALSLLGLIEGHDDLWNDGHVVARLLEACCEILA